MRNSTLQNPLGNSAVPWSHTVSWLSDCKIPHAPDKLTLNQKKPAVDVTAELPVFRKENERDKGQIETHKHCALILLL